MSKAIYLDCFAGISGNMLLGAFLQAGVPENFLRSELTKVIKDFDLSQVKISTVDKNGIQSVYVDVILPEDHHHEDHHHEHEEHHHDHDDHHEHDYEEHHHHDHHEEHHHHEEHEHHHHHEHRTFKTIREMIETSTLAESVKQTSLKIFEVLAKAEGKIHGKTPDEVHFHEVGAIDSIIDIVGIAICLDYLQVKKIFASRVNVGRGFVQCAHGTMMIPAPATTELLTNIPFYHNEYDGDEKELTTPTGAAVLYALAEFSANVPEKFSTEKVAYGAGTWNLQIPNVLRLYLGKYDDASEKNLSKSPLKILETNIDDMNPQDFDVVLEKLFDAGALDVWMQPIYMKKNRPAVLLSALVNSDAIEQKCVEIIFEETTSIGIRVRPIEKRYETSRWFEKISTEFGDVNCKVSEYNGKVVSVSAEYEDCKKISREKNIPVKQIRQIVLENYFEQHPAHRMS